MKNNRTGNIMAIIVIIAIVLTFSCMLLTSCDRDINNQDDNPDTYDRFFMLPLYANDSKDDTSTYPMRIYIDKETRVQYIYNIYEGGMCVLVDAEGKPLLYEGSFED